MIKYNGQVAPDWFKVVKIDDSLGPNVSQNTVKVAGRPGHLDFGNEYDSRTIKVEYHIIAEDETDLRNKIRWAADWLHQEEDKEFVNMFEEDKYYMAKVGGSTDIDEVLRLGSGQINFVCADPYAYSFEEKSIPLLGPTIINYEGTQKSEPLVEVKFTKNTSDLTVSANGKEMRFGVPQDSVKPPTFNPMPLVFDDGMMSTQGWSVADRVFDGKVSGTFKSDNHNFHIGDPGSTEVEHGWYGPSAVRQLRDTVQDFKAQISFTLLGRVPQQGRVQFYVRDASGKQIAMVSLRNGNPKAITPYAEIRMGSTQGNIRYQGYGDKPGVWANWTSGIMTIERKGNRWYFFYGIWDDKKKDYHTRMGIEYIDTVNGYSHPIKQLQIGLAQRNSEGAEGLNSLFIRDVKVWEYKTKPKGEELKPVLEFQEGDELIIDNKAGEIRLNGLPYYSSLHPQSELLELVKGDNEVEVVPADGTVSTLKYKEVFK